MSGPWTFQQARDNCAEAARNQENAEQSLKDAFRDFALKEEAYRISVAEEIVRQHNEGVAWTVAPDLARGDKRVAQLRRERDIAEGVVDAMKQLAWRHTANRKDCQRFSDWSERSEAREAHVDGAEWLVKK